jgi:DNA primase
MSSLLTLFQTHGHDLKREGRTFKTCCPFHADDTPSLSVDPEKGLWQCFGCGEGGDGITFLERSFGLSFGEAADRWREFSGQEPKYSCGARVGDGRSLSTQSSMSTVDVPVQTGQQKGQTMNRVGREVKLNEPPASLTADDIAVLARLQELYAQDLAVVPKALAYLKRRGLGDGETIRSFGLGYVSGSGLPQTSDAQQSQLKDLGILNAKGNETLYGCIVCPLYDQDGHVVSFWGRRITPGPHPHRCLAGGKFGPVGSLGGFIHRQAVKGSSQVVLVEGFLDALACYQAGVRNALPIGGCSVRPDLVKLLHRERVNEVLLALDPDEAGDEGAKLWAQELEQRGIGSVRVRLDHDPCEFFRLGGTALVFREFAAQGESLGQRSDDSEFLLDSNGLLYRVRALAGRQTQEKLKVQILVSCRRSDGDSLTHRDILNLYTHKSRKTFANALLTRFNSIKPNLPCAAVEEDLLTIIEGLEQRARQKIEAREADSETAPMAPEERAAAEAYLAEPNLVSRLQADMEALGYVGEDEAKLLVYLIATSRKLPRPLSGIIGSGSGAGKSFLAELAEQLTPPEEVELFSKLSSQALYYLPKDYLCRKLLILEERAGGEGADYAIRTLQTKDKLTQVVVLKDPVTGLMASRHYEVTGPIAYLETTTQSYLNQENTSRCFEIPLDESAEQTRRIHEHQRRVRGHSGLHRLVSRDIVKRRHHNAQRILEQVRVVIPYAEHLTFPARYLRTRRDHERFLCLIEAVTFLHQFQRVSQTANVDGREVRYIEASVEDYAIAYRLALRVLWVSLDELSRWGRELIESCRQQVEEALSRHSQLTSDDVSWTRRQLREHLGWPDKRLRACLDELVSLEYLQTLDGSKGKAFIYTLNPNFSHNPKALGLLTPEQLQAKLAPNSPPQTSRLKVT